jgi:hypothetical protein
VALRINIVLSPPNLADGSASLLSYVLSTLLDAQTYWETAHPKRIATTTSFSPCIWESEEGGRLQAKERAELRKKLAEHKRRARNLGAFIFHPMPLE